MVYHGPTKACDACRRRRVKCDLGRPSCQRCLTHGIPCPGAKGVPSDNFVDQTDTIHRMVRKQYRRRAQQPEQTRSTRALEERSRKCESEEAESTESANICPPPSTIESRRRSSDDTSRSEGFVGALPTLPRSPSGTEHPFFGAFAFPVDADINAVLEFWLHYPSTEEAKSRSTDFSATWQPILRSFQDIGQGYAVLACLAALSSASTATEIMNTRAAQFRGRAMYHLQDLLKSTKLTPYSFRIIQALLNAEMSAHNFDAAAVHTEVLHQFYRPSNAEGALTVPSLDGQRHSFLWMEIHRAVLTFTQPRVDLEQWLRLYVQNPTSWVDISRSELAVERRSASEIDSKAFPDLRLEQLFVESRLCAQLVTHISEGNGLTQSQSLQLSTALLLLCGRVFEYCLEEARTIEHEVEPRLEGIDQTLRLLDKVHCVAASLAAVYWLRLMARMEYAEVTIPSYLEKLYGAGPQIGSWLAQLLTTSTLGAEHLITLSSSHPEKDRSEAFPRLRLRLWILHTADYLERTTRWRTSGITLGCFHEQLVALRAVLGLHDSPDTYCKLIDGFLPLHADTTFVPTSAFPACRNIEWQYYSS